MEKRLYTGVIIKIYHRSGYGFIKREVGGNGIFFHFKKVDGDAREFAIGKRVIFFEQEGTKGPYAINIKLLEKIESK